MREENLGKGLEPSGRSGLRGPAGRILHLTLHRRWFDAIASGEKKEEYRLMTPYWVKRLIREWPGGRRQVKSFREIHFRNGYAKDAPFMRVRYHGCTLGYGGDTLPEGYRGKPIFAIQLGPILEMRNYPPAGLPAPNPSPGEGPGNTPTGETREAT